MANTIRLRRGSGAPSAGSFAEGEPGWDSTNGRLWVKATSAMVAVGGKYTVSATAPSSPVNGDRWVDSDNGIEYTYIDDGNTSQWVELGPTPIGFPGVTGPTGVGVTGATGVTGPVLLGIPQSVNTTVVASDAGKHINTTTGITVNTSTAFAVGDMCVIYNNSAASITITATGVTLRFAGTATTGNRTLAQRGLANILCVASNDYVISGAGLT